VRLRVSDTGCGMDAKTLEHAFEPFFTTKAPGEGTGLGLSVIHGIVRSHGGEIRLRSEVGQGTTCEIQLPAVSTPSLTVEPESEDIPHGHGERILLVDDEPMLVRLGEQALQRLGYIVVGETQVTAALDRLEREPHVFQLVLSDQTMPGMTGLEFAMRVRALRPDLPVILTSGFSQALTAERIQMAGVREVVSKPYTAAGLARALRRHLPAPRAG
jgi:CheY-like chemotaxis protein